MIDQILCFFHMASFSIKLEDVFSDLSQTTIVIQNSYIMDFTALVKDDEARNSTFLKLFAVNQV